MTEMRQSGWAAGSDPGYVDEPEVTGWVGWVVFAGVIMVLGGLFSVMAGLIALFNSDYYLVGTNGLVVTADYTAWGWAHLLVGIVLACAGLGVMVGQMWARIVGVIAATVSAVLNFAFLGAYPLWGAMVIVLDVIVIYALVAHGREARDLA